jgi:hypothetical protein
MTDNGKSWLHTLLDPIVLLALIIEVSVVLLIGAAVLGIDKGVLLNMRHTEYARGLITYLFASVTIGTAVVLVVSALVGTETDVSQKRFERGKEILSLLVGVFGTIVGFYFGSSAGEMAADIHVSSLRLNPETVDVGGTVTVAAVVSGGQPPYRFGVGFGNDAVEPTEPVGGDGWIVKSLSVRQPQPKEAAAVTVVVQDAKDRRTQQRATVTIGTPGKKG